MKLTFLGSGSAFTLGENNYHSNMLLESDSSKKLLIDCGSDARLSLHEAGYGCESIDAVYLSHLHADHVGGMEWLGFSTYFNPDCKKPKLFISKDLKDDLWDHVLSGGLSTIDEKNPSLGSFFALNSIGNSREFEWEGVSFQLIPTVHATGKNRDFPSYGLYFSNHKKSYFITTDASYTPDEFMPYYEKATLIFHDCETSPKPTGVHASFSDLLQLPKEIRAKMWLYDYQPGDKPDALNAGFLGFVKKGQVFSL